MTTREKAIFLATRIQITIRKGQKNQVEKQALHSEEPSAYTKIEDSARG